MTEETRNLPPLHVSHLKDVQVQAVEQLLNNLGMHGLRVYPTEHERWYWEWKGRTAQANGLGSAIITALYWHFGFLSDAEAGIAPQR